MQELATIKIHYGLAGVYPHSTDSRAYFGVTGGRLRYLQWHELEFLIFIPGLVGH